MDTDQQTDGVLRKMLSTPPKPHKSEKESKYKNGQKPISGGPRQP